jgi:hypothetical protein
MNEDTTAPAPAEPTEPEVEETTSVAPSQDESPAETSEAAPEPQAEPEEEVDISTFERERYAPAPASSSPQTHAVDDIAKELANLPTDETGTVPAEAAAKWFADKLAQNSTQLKSEISTVARQEAMGIVAETAQQQQLLKKYPEITKDKGTLEMVFDLRDAAALRGQGLTLVQAAEKLAKQRQDGRSEGEDSVRRRTTVQATAHLETTTARGQSANESQRDLAQKAFHGKAEEAREARRTFMKGFIQREIENGRIQLS